MDKSNLIDLLSLDLEGTQPDLPPSHHLPKSLGYPPLSEDETLEPYNPYPKSTNIWDPRLVLDLAIGVDDLSDVLVRYGLSSEEFNVLSDTPAFRRELAMTMRDVRENGLPFMKKAGIQAENYLEVLDHLVYNELTPANVRLEAIRSTVRWANLEPKETKGQNGDDNKTTVNVQINF